GFQPVPETAPPEASGSCKQQESEWTGARQASDLGAKVDDQSLQVGCCPPVGVIDNYQQPCCSLWDGRPVSALRRHWAPPGLEYRPPGRAFAREVHGQPALP